MPSISEDNSKEQASFCNLAHPQQASCMPPDGGMYFHMHYPGLTAVPVTNFPKEFPEAVEQILGGGRAKLLSPGILVGEAGITIADMKEFLIS